MDQFKLELMLDNDYHIVNSDELRLCLNFAIDNMYGFIFYPDFMRKDTYYVQFDIRD